jgi:hypothetical protein
MSNKSASGFTVTLKGPGLSFERPVADDIANRIINLVMTGTDNAPQHVNNAGQETGSSASSQNSNHLTGMTIKQFIAQKHPENFYQRVACLAYYLAHAADMPHFKTKDISKANTDAAASKFSNATAFVNDATAKYGYLSAAGGGNKQISAFGEQVVEALPDREKVKQLHDEYSPRARKKAKKKTK